MSASSATSFAGADTVMTGLAFVLLSLTLFSISMFVAVALCVKSNGRETSKEMDFCGRRIRKAPPFDDDATGFSASVDGGLDGCECTLSCVAVENRAATGGDVGGNGAPKDGGDTFNGGSDDGSEDPDGAGMRLRSIRVSQMPTGGANTNICDCMRVICSQMNGKMVAWMPSSH